MYSQEVNIINGDDFKNYYNFKKGNNRELFIGYTYQNKNPFWNFSLQALFLEEVVYIIPWWHQGSKNLTIKMKKEWKENFKIFSGYQKIVKVK